MQVVVSFFKNSCKYAMIKHIYRNFLPYRKLCLLYDKRLQEKSAAAKEHRMVREICVAREKGDGYAKV